MSRKRPEVAIAKVLPIFQVTIQVPNELLAAAHACAAAARLSLSLLLLLLLVLQGAAFAADWCELRSVTRNRLVGRVLPPDLAAAVEAATTAAAGAGAFGVSTTRYLQDIKEGDPNLPPGARLVNVSWFRCRV